MVFLLKKKKTVIFFWEEDKSRVASFKEKKKKKGGVISFKVSQVSTLTKVVPHILIKIFAQVHSHLTHEIEKSRVSISLLPLV